MTKKEERSPMSLARFLALLLVLLPAPILAQTRARTILFVGNSFTFGAGSPVRRYRPESVADLNGDGVGGVPALFRTFAEQAGLDWAVSLETSGGKDLAWHWTEKRGVIDRRWDAVVLQGYSTLDARRPGDATEHTRYAGALADLFTRANPAVDVQLVATWTRADLTYRPGSPWSGKPVAAMADDLQAASEQARAGSGRSTGWCRWVAPGPSRSRAASPTPIPMTASTTAGWACGPLTITMPPPRAITWRRW